MKPEVLDMGLKGPRGHCPSLTQVVGHTQVGCALEPALCQDHDQDQAHSSASTSSPSSASCHLQAQVV